MSIHKGHRERMRKQLKTSGMDSLSDVQVLEVLLYYAIPRADTNPIAHRLLERFGSLSGVLEAAPDELLNIEGMGDAAAQLISLIPQLERRHFIDIYPVSIVLIHGFTVVFVDVDEGIIDDRNDPLAGIPPYGSESMDLLHVNIFETGKFGQHPLGCIVDTFVGADESPHKRPLSLSRFHLAFEQQKIERALLLSLIHISEPTRH